MDGAWVSESVVEVAADMLGVFSSLEVLAQPPRRIGFRHRPVRLQRQQVIFVECCQLTAIFASI